MDKNTRTLCANIFCFSLKQNIPKIPKTLPIFRTCLWRETKEKVSTAACFQRLLHKHTKHSLYTIPALSERLERLHSKRPSTNFYRISYLAYWSTCQHGIAAHPCVFRAGFLKREIFPILLGLGPAPCLGLIAWREVCGNFGGSAGQKKTRGGISGTFWRSSRRILLRVGWICNNARWFFRMIVNSGWYFGNSCWKICWNKL